MRKVSFSVAIVALGLFGSAVAVRADDAKPAAPAAAPAAPAAAAPKPADADVQKAQAALANTDPTKIVKKVDDATTVSDTDPAVEMQMNGMWLDKDGNPTPHFSKDGTMDWFSFSGYRRYGANCLVCHGPDALGSSYAPALMDSLKTLTYPQFLQTVAAGKKDVNNSSNLVMPSFGDNKNVQCYINDIYVYIRARSLGIMDRARPSKHEEKPAVYGDQETACLGF
jgi:methanol metabolism-related c-type cytochrome